MSKMEEKKVLKVSDYVLLIGTKSQFPLHLSVVSLKL